MFTNKFSFFHILILLLIIHLINSATLVNYICSDYCNSNDCSAGKTNTSPNCGGSSNCRSQFVINSGSCTIDLTVYTVILEQLVTGVSTFNDTSTANCGIYPLSGIFNAGDNIVVYNGPISFAHYKMRLITSVIWIDTTWSWTDNINVKINGSTKSTASFGCWTNCIYIANQCGVSTQV